MEIKTTAPLHAHVTSIEIGLTSAERISVVDLLNQSLANAYVLLVKTKKAHWDVVGPQFRSLHLLLDEQYEMLSTETDELAERARMLGGHSIATMVEFIEMAEFSESREVLSNATHVVNVLVVDHEAVCRSLRRTIDAAGDAGDIGTADLLTTHIQQHEKMAWMLRSFVEGPMVGGRPALVAAARGPEAVSKENLAQS
jgi:starvation-inducible DNA-binding protein